MTLALAAILLQIASIVGFILWRVFWASKSAGQYEERVAELTRDMREMKRFQLRVAARLGINGE